MPPENPVRQELGWGGQTVRSELQVGLVKELVDAEEVLAKVRRLLPGSPNPPPSLPSIQ
jgi:hypothetical protein